MHYRAIFFPEFSFFCFPLISSTGALSSSGAKEDWATSQPAGAVLVESAFSAMSNLEELKDALRDTLAARGSLGQIQARVRAEIFSALEETVSLGDPNIYHDYRPP